MGTTLSVIVPYHNSEHTLERTLASLSNQTATGLEIILVNDGSTDRSHRIVEQYLNGPDASKHKFLDVSYEFQRGASEAFNIGLRQAGGIYVCKCDSDDTVPSHYYARLLSEALESNADIVATPIEFVTGSSNNILSPRHFGQLNKMAINTANFSLCNKIVRRELLLAHNIEAYPHIDCWEDLGVIARILTLTPRTRVVNDLRYQYHITPNKPSLSRSNCTTLLRDHLMTAMLVEIWFNERGVQETYAEFLHYLKFISKVKMLRCMPRDVDRWKRTFPEANQGIMNLKNVSLPHRILFSLIAKLPTGISQWAVEKVGEL